MRYYIDTEFQDASPAPSIHPISIGIVAEDGREFYGEFAYYSWEQSTDWLRENVKPHLRGGPSRVNPFQMKYEIKHFIGDDPKPDFWGYYAAYDWVVFCQVFGGMMSLPPAWPKYIRDLRPLIEDAGNPPMPEQVAHDALADAHWHKAMHEALTAHRRAA